MKTKEQIMEEILMVRMEIEDSQLPKGVGEIYIRFFDVFARWCIGMNREKLSEVIGTMNFMMQDNHLDFSIADMVYGGDERLN